MSVEAVSQIEFAQMLGVAKSYVTQLKQAGRLVMTADGKQVDVQASREKIRETADPVRLDVASRWAGLRGKEIDLAAAEEEAEPEMAGPQGASYAEARARKENAAADIAEMERDRQRGRLVEREAVEAAFDDVFTQLRQALEQQPHRIAPALVGLDMNAMRATLKMENAALLRECIQEFGAQLKLITASAEGGA